MTNHRLEAWFGAFAALTILTLTMLGSSAQASTVAYWRFEDGVADQPVQHSGEIGVWSADVQDVSGNGNHLSAWMSGEYAGYAYRSDVSTGTIAATGQANTLSVQNTGDVPGMFTGATGIQTIAPAQFTVEASFNLENGGYRTFIGRDSYGAATTNAELAAVYFQLLPGNSLAFKYADQAGYWHDATSAPDLIQTWDFGTQTPADGRWYHAAAVSDGSTLSVYLADATEGSGYQLVAQADLTASGSTNTAMTAGMGDGGDWDAGNWSVGRGLYNGGHGDRAYGLIDEVRISDNAVAIADLLHFNGVQNLSIEVNTTTGNVTVRNDSIGPITLDYYEITSDAGALSTTGWNSLDDQNYDAGPPADFDGSGTVDGNDLAQWKGDFGLNANSDADNDGDSDLADLMIWQQQVGQSVGPGDGWVEAGGSSSEILSELLLDEVGSTIQPGETLSLGAAYNTAIGGEDLHFSYGRPGSGLFIGGVEYVTSVSSSVAVPEPTSVVLLALALLGWSRRR